MPLPVLEAIKYETIVPSTKKKIEFRPFLVKEEKILLVAQESDDDNEIIRAVKDIIDVCTFNKLKIDELTVYDLEFLFLQIRAKSVGEDVNFNLKCKNCEALTEVHIDLSSVKIDYPKKKINPKLELNDTIGVTLRPLSMNDVGSVKDSSDFVEVIALCIETVYDENSVHDKKDINHKELIAFIESFSHEHMLKIEEFLTNQPTLRHKIEFDCKECSHKNEYMFEGLQDFFV